MISIESRSILYYDIICNPLLYIQGAYVAERDEKLTASQVRAAIVNVLKDKSNFRSSPETVKQDIRQKYNATITYQVWREAVDSLVTAGRIRDDNGRLTLIVKPK